MASGEIVEMLWQPEAERFQERLNGFNGLATDFVQGGYTRTEPKPQPHRVPWLVLQRCSFDRDGSAFSSRFRRRKHRGGLTDRHQQPHAD
jgi:hypothetical protein